MSKQTVLGRVAQLAGANVDALLDRAEDPQQMVDRLIREYTAAIAEAADTVAATAGGLRLMTRDRAEDVAAAAEWGGKAATASRRADELRTAGIPAAADRFDRLARIALGRQLRSEQEAAAAGSAITAQTQVLDRLRPGLDRMRRTLDGLRSRREALVDRSRSAPARDRLPDAVRDVDLLDPAGELSRFEDKLRREEARAAGGREPAASCLDAQFESPDEPFDAAEVDARLARLKSGAARPRTGASRVQP
ncbi:PspA/IM30 family protein [Actinacidiphila sp. ITFR-21]|uniref:PspA/IM30 family protein n=1 Tax=Actinacidiphila sp. ITFR-21 TaxID=3075199 RepID=UPI00288960D0|nr:PspA/IM30 family protein [Streptomyces sp. ITFR-21]WNI17517.1 PspA/IM30 family protein [Streptomyces sp. ITFR-21]